MTLISNVSEQLPQHCWPVSRIKELEQKLADATGRSSFGLMRLAGEALFNLSQQRFPNTRHCLILCGGGNNGGDGYVFATLAQHAGIKVTLVDASTGKAHPAEAKSAIAQWRSADKVHSITAEEVWPTDIDLIVDALCGIGIQQAPRQPYQKLIEQANQHSAPILSVDVPSGLNADTGQVAGSAIRATATLTFITLKPGLITGQGRVYTGKLYYADLGFNSLTDVPEAPIRCFQADKLATWLPERQAAAHKGDMGKLVLIGGEAGTAGAIRLSGEGALRSGAGLVRVLTHSSNIVPLLTARPELMTNELTADNLENALDWADVVAIGPGLGQSEWGKAALRQVKLSKKPMLWDADALNLLAMEPNTRQNRILTPHPGEAARLLDISVAEVESDRVATAQQLVERFGGVAVLKGSGTVIASAGKPVVIAYVGNPGMATGGMGDVLTGVISALLAQNISLWSAACAGVIAHGHAADLDAAQNGTRGMLATDVIHQLRKSVNPIINND